MGFQEAQTDFGNQISLTSLRNQNDLTSLRQIALTPPQTPPNLKSNQTVFSQINHFAQHKTNKIILGNITHWNDSLNTNQNINNNGYQDTAAFKPFYKRQKSFSDLSSILCMLKIYLYFQWSSEQWLCCPSLNCSSAKNS